MAIESMTLVNMAGVMKSLDAVLVKCCESGCFHMEVASQVAGNQSGFTTLNESNPYAGSLKRLQVLSSAVSHKLSYEEYSKLGIRDMDGAKEYLTKVEETLGKLDGRRIELQKSIADREQALIQVKHLLGLKVDFQELFACKHVKLRFGRLPMDGYLKLPYYEDKNFYFVPFENDQNYYWGIYFVPTKQADEIDVIFNSLYFERVRVPDYVNGTAAEAVVALNRLIDSESSELRQIKDKMDALLAREIHTMNMLYSKLRFLHDTFELRKSVSVLGNEFYIVAFVPTINIEQFMESMNELPNVSVVEEECKRDEKLSPPVKLKNNKLFRPFETFVEMYGLPTYGDIDPTPLVAITYTLLFGIMFGDLGQGLVIMLIGILLWSLKKISFGKVLTRIGASSAVFGCVYGSVFGFEELLNPVYKALFGLEEKPVDVFAQSNTLLLLAIGLGATLIVLSMVLNIIVGFRHKNLERAIFGSNGIAGLVLYVSVAAAAVLLLMFKINIVNPVFIIICIVLPIVLLFFREPIAKRFEQGKAHERHEGSVVDFILSNFFECFEFLLSYVTNTMSFLRIGGFILSHAGMMLVVFTLAESVGEGASPIVIVLGNIFVIGMEGLIVGIQTLRLEFYEVFSRFYDGDGRPFKPVRVQYEEKHD